MRHSASKPGDLTLLSAWADDTQRWLEAITQDHWEEEYDQLLFGEHYDQLQRRSVIRLERLDKKTVMDELRFFRLQRLGYHFDALTKCWMPKDAIFDRSLITL